MSTFSSSHPGIESPTWLQKSAIPLDAMLTDGRPPAPSRANAHTSASLRRRQPETDGQWSSGEGSKRAHRGISGRPGVRQRCQPREGQQEMGRVDQQRCCPMARQQQEGCSGISCGLRRAFTTPTTRVDRNRYPGEEMDGQIGSREGSRRTEGEKEAKEDERVCSVQAGGAWF
mmetsp:Transcript_2489/g.6574  ORF Transcript_2489/g.6574 Transcript_2489/m.6574 type:complete len:173 (+) Transcript_2489:97-615(+)